MKSNTTDSERIERLRNHSIFSIKIKKMPSQNDGKAETEPEVVGDIRPIPAGQSKYLEEVNSKHQQLKFKYYE